ncbi:hypothetical protein CK203_111140 [Vitis vinifera]|uniref:Uncharacterized protein n=1 Tax=Vitis vinifera TaxID=29760 RepID=A0A438EP87_VITVI|nr:hypothetical protein CK203_111140 [Vitis vinifera]
MASEANYIFSDTEKAEKGYVKGAVTDMVTDALVVKPLSTMSIVDLLNKSNINEVGGELEEKVVDSTMREVWFEAADKRIAPVQNCLDECLPWEYRPCIKNYVGFQVLLSEILKAFVLQSFWFYFLFNLKALPVRTVISPLTKKSKVLKLLKEAWLCEIFLENIAYTIAKKE